MSRIDLIQLRRGTAAAWTSTNPVLAAGEPGVESDTGKFKFGDGVTAWNSLAYGGATGSNPTGPAGGVLAGTYPNPSFAADMATQAELDAAIAAHLAAADPHPQYLTQAEGDARYTTSASQNFGRWFYVDPTTYSIDLTGVASANAGIASAWAACPAGWTMVFPVGKYNISAALDVLLTKHIGVRATGCEFIRTSVNSRIRVSGSKTQNGSSGGSGGSAWTLSSPSNTTRVTADGQTVFTWTVTTNVSTNLARGDFVYVMASDPIPDGDGTTCPAQWFTVESSSGTTLVLSGRPRETMSASLTMYKIDDFQIDWEGGEFYDNATMMAGASGNSNAHLEFQDLIGYRLNNTKVTQSTGPGFTSRRAVASVARTIRGVVLLNDLTNNKVGYLVNNSGSEHCVFDDLFGQRLRHVYSANLGNSATQCGRCVGNKVTGRAISTEQTAFDEHPNAWGTQFLDCQAEDCYQGLGFRGIDTQVIGGRFERCNAGEIYGFTQNTRRSTRYRIHGVRIVNTGGTGILIQPTFYQGGGNTASFATNDQVTTGVAHGLSVNDAVAFNGISGGAPLANNTVYYVKTVVSPTVITLSATAGGATIDITSTGTANMYATVTAATDVINTGTPHGLYVGATVAFTGLTGAAGLTSGLPVYVLTVPSANTITVSTTPGGSTLNITTDGFFANVVARENAPIYFSDTIVYTTGTNATAPVYLENTTAYLDGLTVVMPATAGNNAKQIYIKNSTVVFNGANEIDTSLNTVGTGQKLIDIDNTIKSTLEFNAPLRVRGDLNTFASRFAVTFSVSGGGSQPPSIHTAPAVVHVYDVATGNLPTWDTSITDITFPWIVQNTIAPGRSPLLQVHEPAQYNLLGWNYPLPLASSNSAPTGGTLQVVRLKIVQPTLISNLHLCFTANGATLTANSNWIGLLDVTTRAQLATSADQSTNWSSGSTYKTCAMTTPYKALTDVLAAFYMVGTTIPTVIRTQSGQQANGPLSGANSQWATADTGLTTGGIPNPAGALAASGATWWVGWS